MQLLPVVPELRPAGGAITRHLDRWAHLQLLTLFSVRLCRKRCSNIVCGFRLNPDVLPVMRSLSSGMRAPDPVHLSVSYLLSLCLILIKILIIFTSNHHHTGSDRLHQLFLIFISVLPTHKRHTGNNPADLKRPVLILLWKWFKL